MGSPKNQAVTSATTNNYYKPAPAEICRGNMRFLITDRPTDYTINQFIEVFINWKIIFFLLKFNKIFLC